MQPSIEYLISLSANINTSNESESKFNHFNTKDEEGATGNNRESSPEEDAFEVDTDFTYLNIDDEELQKQKEEFKKFELMRKREEDCELELPLEFQEDNVNLENYVDDFITTFNKSTFPEEALPEECTSNENLENFYQKSNSKIEEKRKTETESLCGLKIQYRFGGPEASSDDDADVVIEKESSDQNITNSQNTLTNVCQFLSLSTESSPKTTFPQVEMISTASPSSSPINERFKAGFNATLSRIKSTIQRGFKIMVIIRGLPGSGKSYLARNIAHLADEEDAAQFVFSTDDFFMKKGRIYDFDPMKLSDAHAFNQQQVSKAVKDGISPIIIDNTNTQCWEMRPYVILAVQYGYFIEVLEPNTRWAFNVNELTKRNVHNVPRQSIQRMMERFDRNITAAKLLKMFSLKYESFNTPPQPCLNDFLLKKRASDANVKETKKNNRKNKRISEKEKKEDYVPADFANATVVDAVDSQNLTALQLAMKTFGGDDEDDLSPKENVQRLIEDKWDENGTSWEDEQLKVEIKHQESNNLKETLNEESSSYRPYALKVDDNVKNIHINELHSNLGAIGSERKNSFIRNSPELCKSGKTIDFSKNWDFDFLLHGRRTRSVAPKNEKPEDSNNSSSSIKSENSTGSNSEKTSPTEELKEAANTLDKDSPDSGTKSSTTESFEHIDSNSEDLLFEIRETLDAKEATDEEIDNPENFVTNDKVSFGSLMKFIKKSFLGANDLKNKKALKSSETVIDSLTEKLHSPVKDHSYCKMKTLDYEHCIMSNEEDNYSKVPDNEEDISFDSNLNDTLSKKLLEVAQESENNSNLVYEAQNNFKCIDFLENEIIIKTNDDDSNNYPSKEISNSFINVSDTHDIDTSVNDSNLENKLISILMEKDNLEEISSKFDSLKLTGPLVEAMMPSENEKLILEEKEIQINTESNFDLQNLGKDLKNLSRKNSDGTNEFFETIDNMNFLQIEEPVKFDNMNLISWKESPFPTYGIDVPVSVEESKTIITSDASTNTNFYDLNVSFVGGTNESGYKVLDAFNRSINEGQPPRDFEATPPRKLKLHKSSMTNDVDILLQLPSTSGESEETDKEMVQGLIDMFPHIPENYIIDVYKHLCKGDSHWAIDVLLDGVPSGGILTQSKSTENTNSPTVENKNLKQSISTDSSESTSSSQSRKKEKSQLSEDTLALKKHLEEKVIISEASYHPHILRVRKWKNGEPDVSTKEIMEAQAKNKDVLQFENDLSPVELEPSISPTNENIKEKEESDGDESSGSEETMEFDLGWEFIKNLESQVGHVDFQLPVGLFPVIQLKKSLAQEIYALWIESVQQQMDDQQELLDSLIAKGKLFD